MDINCDCIPNHFSTKQSLFLDILLITFFFCPLSQNYLDLCYKAFTFTLSHHFYSKFIHKKIFIFIFFLIFLYTYIQAKLMLGLAIKLPFPSLLFTQSAKDLLDQIYRPEKEWILDSNQATKEQVQGLKGSLRIYIKVGTRKHNQGYQINS